MILSKIIRASSLLALCLATLTVSGQTQTKNDNNDDLTLGTSWVSGNAPDSSTVAVWDNAVSTAANCTNTISSAVSWGGVQILNPAAPVKIQTNGLATGTGITLGSSGIDLSSASADLWLAPALTTAADQNWIVAAGRTLTLGETNRNINIANNVTVGGHLVYNALTFLVQSGGSLTITNGDLIEPSPRLNGITVVNIGANSSGGTVNHNGGTLKIIRSNGTTGSPVASMQIASSSSSTAVYTITNGSLQDISAVGISWIVLGAGSGSTGTLNVDGTANLQLNKILLGNSGSASGILNLTNGTITFASDTFDVGRSSSTGHGFVNVYGGTLSFPGNMNLGRGPGDGTLNVSGGTVNLSGLNVSGANSGAGPGTNTMSGGSLTITNNLTLKANGSAGSAEVNLNGGTLAVGSVTTGTGSGAYLAFNLNGGTLKARTSGTLISSGVTNASVKAGGAIIDTAGFNSTVAARLLNGTGGADGGLTKLGLGRLTLSGTNTYTGYTLVSAGSLYLNTTIHAGGPISLSDPALLRTTLAGSGTTLPCSSLTLGASTGATLEFDLGTNPNASVPLVYATNLTVNGTISVNVFGTALAQGVIPLIQYDGSISGSGAFTLSLVQGWAGFVTNNTTAKQIQLVITGASVLDWRAFVNTNWDTATVNWFDLSNNVATAFGSGATVFFDDSTSNSLVYLTASLSPGATTVNNSLSNYTFAGVGQISGVGGLTKIGSGTLTMAVSNNYSAATVISNGVFRLGTNNAIPGNVTLEGRLEMNGFSDSIGSLNGSNGVVNNASVVSAVLGVTGGTFAGQITNSGGNLTLSKTSGGTLTLPSINGYTGGTTNGGGTLLLASEGSMGPGPLTISGATLGWLDASAHTLTNKLVLAGTATFGTAGNAALTVANTADFAAGGRTLNCVSDVSFPNGFTNGWLAGKGAAANLTVKNSISHNPLVGGSGSIVYGSGNITFDNCAIIEENGNVRLRAGNDNETCRLILTNGSSFLMTNTSSQNFRFNDGGTAVDTTNELDLAGTLTITPYGGANSKLQMGSAGDPAGQNILNLLSGGVLSVKQITDVGPNSFSTLNFNGGTLSPNSSELATDFIHFLDACYVLDGGGFIDTAGFDATLPVAISIQAGGSGTGGLTKMGAGILYLNGSESYGGPTFVSAGGLSGSGSLSSPVRVASGASIGAGTATSIGTLTISSSLTLSNGSTTLMRINSDSVASDSISGMTTVNYGGTLMVTNTGTSDLMLGQVFTLFGASAYNSSFAAYTLPSLPAGLGWDLSGLSTNGSIQVATAASRPSFTSVVLSGTNLILSGSGGPVSGSYHLLASTNVTLSLSGWTSLGAFSFGPDGKFTNSIPVTAAIPQRFFAVQVP